MASVLFPRRNPPHQASSLFLVLPFAILTASACSDSPLGPAGDPTTDGPAVIDVDRPFFSGVFLGDEESGPENIEAAIASWTRLVGKQPALVKTYHTLDADFSAGGWAGRVMRNAARAGATNFVALDLTWRGAPERDLLPLLAGGEADAALRRVARELAGYGELVLLEPGWEMNGDWSYPWQGALNGADQQAPARFVEAWRHMVEVFRSEGAHNVRWVFSPNAGNPVARSGAGASHWNWYGNYYPGEAYVDYVGVHGFNAPELWGGGYQDFATLFDGDYADRMLSDLAARYSGKPILLGEFASEEVAGRDKGRWIADAYRVLRSRRNVVGAVWFNMNKETDWRVDSSASALTAFREAMSGPLVASAFDESSVFSGTRLALR